jgi:hypothetical protein
MRSSPKLPALRLVFVILLLTCVFASTSEDLFCPDCNPVRILSDSSMLLRSIGSSQVTSSHHSPLTCPVCLSPLLVASDHAPTILASFDIVPQEPPRLSPGTPGPIYEPPRIAS